jgi:hypothetical protein
MRGEDAYARRPVQTTGHDTMIVAGTLEHTEHNRADKGDGDIRGNNAQSADERSEEGHLGNPWFTSLPANADASKTFPREKVSAAVAGDSCTAAEPQGDVVKES